MDRALDENPYHLHSLRWQRYLAESERRQREAARIEETIAELCRGPACPSNPVVLSFAPPIPKFEPHHTVYIDGARIFDHSRFGVTTHNTSNRPVEIESVTLTSTGTAAASGAG